MTDADAAAALAALWHEARLQVFRLLVRAGAEGLNVGEVGRLLGIPASTLAHHLGMLVGAGLVVQEKQGRAVANHARHEVMRRIFAHVDAEGCAGVPRSQGNAA